MRKPFFFSMVSAILTGASLVALALGAAASWAGPGI
jgi:hypothetical protein